MATSIYISRRVVLPEGVRPAAVVVDDAAGRITAITEANAAPAADAVYDLGEDVLLPGLVDTHVHINDPGRTTWETFRTATRAAAAGGVTTLVDMPLNCLPATTSVAALEQKRRAADGQTYVDWRPWGGAVGDGLAGNAADLVPLAEAGVAGFKCFLIYPGCEGLGAIDEAALRLAMPQIAQTGLPLLVHAELAGPLDRAAKALTGANWTQYATYLRSRPDEAEVEAVELMVRLCREYRARVHIVHVSSALCLPAIRAAKTEGLPLTAETCPHYLHFAAETIPAGSGATLYKCAPPIRSAANRELLWQALQEGTLDLVASDHSPCPPEMKRLEEGDFASAWGGIAGLSLVLPVMWTALRQRGLGLSELARWMSEKPAALGGMSGRKGRIAAGLDADLVVLAAEQSFQPTTAELHYLHPVSPYLGERLVGVVRQTIVRGQSVYRDGLFAEPARGCEVRS